MLTYLRYALATVCFTVTVGCLALWLYSALRIETWDGANFPMAATTLNVEGIEGTFCFQFA